MANKKVRTPKIKKQRQTKYTKLALVCAKELAAKKKALVAAEKRLAKAQLTHQELLSEVARLDMLDRSLKAVNEKSQPPQNIKYVYTYPQWVWNPYVYNPGQWTFTTTPTYVGYNTPNTSGATGIVNGGLNGGNFQGGSLLTSNGSYQSPTVTCTLANSDTFTFTNSGNVQIGSVQTTPSGGLPDAGPTLQFDGSGAPNWVPANDGSLVVDLTTHEPYEAPEEQLDELHTRLTKEAACIDLVEA
jgi:hypothetical protein